MTLGQTTAILAALLVAVNPFYIWHAQDGRMYSLLAMLSAASIWFALRLLQNRPGRFSGLRNGLAYWAITVLSLLTHYFAWWVLLAENVAALLIIWKQDRRPARLGRWLLWQIAVFLALLPWLAFALGLLASHTSTWIPPLTPLEMLKRSLMTFSLGSTLEPMLSLAFSLVMGALFVLGCTFPSRPARRSLQTSGRGLLLLFAGIPLLATMLLSLIRPAFDEKYLIAVTAFYLILVAHGLHFLGAKSRVLGALVGAVILVASSWSLFNYHFVPEYAKSPGWRSLVQSIEARAADGDLIVQNYPDPGLGYYYRGDLPVRLLPAAVPSPQERTDRALQKLVADHRRIWLIPAPAASWDADGLVERWLKRHADLVDEREIGSLRLQLYQTPQTFLEGMEAVDVNLDKQIKLLGYRLAPETTGPVLPGDHLSLTLYWQALGPVDIDYTVFVHLSDPGEGMGGQHDGQPADGTYPTTAWSPGQIVVDRHTLKVSPEAPAGRYRILVGLYDGSTGQRLTIAGGSSVLDENRIMLTTLEVANPAEEGPDSQEQGQ
jgi:hypothetical protein